MIQVVASILSLCGIVGQPQGDCIPAPPDDWRDVSILVSVYDPLNDPELMDEENINCDNSCGSLALAAMDPAFYGHVAACPLEWHIGYISTVVVSHPMIGERTCLDTGGAIECEYGLFGDRWQWICRIDLLDDLSEGTPQANGWLRDGWSLWWVSTWNAIERLLG